LIWREADPASLILFLERATDLICKELMVKKNTKTGKVSSQPFWFPTEEISRIAEKQIEMLKAIPVSVECHFLRPETWYQVRLFGKLTIPIPFETSQDEFCGIVNNIVVTACSSTPGGHVYPGIRRELKWQLAMVLVVTLGGASIIQFL